MECLGETRNVYSVTVGKSEGKVPFFRPRLAQTIEIYLQEREWEIMNVIYLAMAGFL